MRGLKRLAAIFLALTASTSPAAALLDLPREFATCTGRYSAMMEHAWLMRSGEAEEHAHYRATFVSLLEAVDDNPGPVTFHRRIAAKAAQAALLQTATFGDDGAQSDWARARAEALIAECRRLLLDS